MGIDYRRRPDDGQCVIVRLPVIRARDTTASSGSATYLLSGIGLAALSLLLRRRRQETLQCESEQRPRHRLTGTARYGARFPAFAVHRILSAGPRPDGLQPGTRHLPRPAGRDHGPQLYRGGGQAAARGGINFFDTAINYRHQRSERSIGTALGADVRARASCSAMKSWSHQGRLPHARRGPGVAARRATSWAGCIRWRRISWPTRSTAAAPIWISTPSTSSTCTIRRRS